MCKNCDSQKYVPLHLHTQYSIDSVTSIKDLHKKINDMQFEAVAVTDHASLSGVVEHWKYGTEYFTSSGGKFNKPITGCEIYLYWDNCPYPKGSQYASGKKRISHLTLLCDGDKGYETIVRLVNRAKLRGEYGFRSPVYLSELVADNEGLICLSGCPASFAQDEDEKLSFDFVRILESAFGKDRLYIEAQFHNLTNPRHFDRAILLHNTFGLDMVYTNDCHFLNIENLQEYQKFKKWVFGGKDDEDENFNLTMLYLADSDEVVEQTKQISSLTGKDYNQYIHPAMENSLKIARKLGIVDMSAKSPIFPPIKDDVSKFNQMIADGIKERNIDVNNKIYMDRLNKEITVITSKGFVPYFVVVADLCQFAKNRGIVQGVGRGSAAGSLVSYIMGITHLDPIKYNLTFERFLSEHRNALPDIDSDFSGNGRDRVIEYAGMTYAMKPVATFVFFGYKEALNFAARHCGVPFQDIDELRKKLEEENIELEEFDDEDKLPKLISDFFKKWKHVRLEEMFYFVLNKSKSIGQHAGGIVYVDNLAPLEIKTSGGIVVGLPEGKHGEFLSHRGYVKVDILGISTLEVLQDCFNNLGVMPPEPVGIEPAIENLTGSNNAGIFQFKGHTMSSLLSQFKPKTFMDLVVLNGAGRGGADTEKYLEMRDSGNSLVWGNAIDDICKNTFGIPIFQEQFMSIYAFLLSTDFDDPLGRVDKMRKQIAKFRSSPEANKKKEELRKEIIQKSLDVGMNASQGQLLWHFFELAHGYSFNLAHSTCYSYIAWQLLWYKHNHPLVYQAATLNACYKDEMQKSINELQKDGIEIVEPDVCNSTNSWTAKDGKIYAPLTIIKGLGELACQEIMNARPFNSVKEFMDTVNLRRVNSAIRYKLYMCGALNCFQNIDIDLLDISNYDLTVNKDKYKNDIFEVKVFNSVIVDQINKHLEYLNDIFDESKEHKIVHGIVATITKENSKNPRLKGDVAIQFKLRDSGGTFLGWFSLSDLKQFPRLGMLADGVHFAALSTYGRILAPTLKIF